MLLTKSVYVPPEPRDGTRILVMRFWPRGIRRDAMHEWWRELAPSAALLGRYRNGEAEWNEFMAAYMQEIDTDAGRTAMLRIGSLAARSNVTLLCHERDGECCHRHVLRDVICDPRLLGTEFEPQCADRRGAAIQF